MIQFPTGGILVQEFHELPAIPDVIEELFADFETSSGSPREYSTNPHRHCYVIGVAVAFERTGQIYFVPKELLVTGWWRDVLRVARRWINHNIKYDTHVSTNDLSCPPPRSCELCDTLNDIKLIDSDRTFKGGYGLDVLAKDLLLTNIDEFGERMLPYLDGNKDYGNIPIDIMAEYACIDIRTEIPLWIYIQQNMPEESKYVWNKEHRVTRLLYEIEHRGIKINPTDVKKTELDTIVKMLVIDHKMEKICGRSFMPTSSKDCYDVLCNQYGLPVMAFNEPSPTTGIQGPSFDWAALQLYLTHPYAPKELVKLMIDYRECSTFRSLFLEKWQEIVDPNGYMHATYNQSVRTGRMSCSDPNLQQLSKLAKTLIVPPEGYGIVVVDASQIEFRFIVHYTENKKCIEAYHRDPWTDFHQFVADSIPCARDPAKTLNFMMGYGGGKEKTISSLSVNDGFVAEIMAEVESSGARSEAKASMFKMLAQQRAMKIYGDYHNKLLPELKPASRQAAMAARRRGYVRNLYGRRRHLPEKAAHIAFNSVCQSGAGDMFKERMVALNEEVPELLQVAAVHDEIVGYAPLEMLERDDSLLEKITGVLNEPERPLLVPVRWSAGWSDKSWAHAKSKDREKHFH